MDGDASDFGADFIAPDLLSTFEDQGTEIVVVVVAEGCGGGLRQLVLGGGSGFRGDCRDGGRFLE